MRNGYLPHRRLAKAQASLHISAVSSDPLLFKKHVVGILKFRAKMHAYSLNRGLGMYI